MSLSEDEVAAFPVGARVRLRDDGRIGEVAVAPRTLAPYALVWLPPLHPEDTRLLQQIGQIGESQARIGHSVHVDRLERLEDERS